jgi:hypothetical protein
MKRISPAGGLAEFPSDPNLGRSSCWQGQQQPIRRYATARAARKTIWNNLVTIWALTREGWVCTLWVRNPEMEISARIGTGR